MFKILRMAFSTTLRYPQSIFGMFQVPWNFFRRFSRFIVLLMSLSLTFEVIPAMYNLQADMAASRQAIPDFTVVDGQLQLAQDQKPVYYQSHNFQLVIDDTVTLSGPSDSPSIPTDIANRLSAQHTTSLFLFKDRVFLQVNNLLFSDPSFYQNNQGAVTPASLSQQLGMMSDYFWVIVLMTFLLAYLVSYLIYWGFILLVSLLVHFAMLRSPNFKRFSNSIRMVMTVTFGPFVLYSFLRILLPLGWLFYFFLAVYTLVFIYWAHQRFMRAFLEHFAETNLQETLEELEQDEAVSPEDFRERINTVLRENRAQQAQDSDSEPSAATDELTAPTDASSDTKPSDDQTGAASTPESALEPDTAPAPDQQPPSSEDTPHD